ncbi:amidohydrolase family protein [Streptomyces sp. NBC_01795]|uniref:amidohydrolase family protein n=1 Tax=unclassified Streptomyces TaxID=2593676 RepID=UPI002DD95485|nr:MULTISPECIES: amidohydrolase family protein [unclassified Streptomyces]WSA90595.1 amidohydrolase family protein [Streptomyces sp. NBC_01795]WSB74921.1 amidohydrolase family protein [Streptomyces sp. NBC_01775]WSS16798.1 amidohydrolase family protein [Streptomyces sp. NBC_01186]
MAVDSRFFRSSSSGRPSEYGAIYQPDDAWLALTAPEVVQEPELVIVDAHHHLWERPYPYRPQDFTADLASSHRVAATVYVECAVGYRTTGPEALRPVGETEHVAKVARDIQAQEHAPQVASGIIGFADLGLGEAVEEVLESHIDAGEGRFRGIRFGTGRDDSPVIENTQSAKRPNMLAERQIRAGARELEKLDLSLDVWLFHTQLSEVAELADDLPGLRIVLDHCGGPLGYGPYATNKEEHFARWREGLLEVALRPNVVCKLGGLLARGAAFDYLNAPVPPASGELARTWAPWLETCVEAFGADRCMFESNFPVEKMGTSYTTLWNAFKAVVSSASDDEKRWLFSETARRTYRLV